MYTHLWLVKKKIIITLFYYHSKVAQGHLTSFYDQFSLYNNYQSCIPYIIRSLPAN